MLDRTVASRAAAIEEMTAVEIGIVFPVLPGKKDALIAFANAISGERKAEYLASQTTVNRESWFLQAVPGGHVCVLHFEADDIGAVFAGLAGSQEPFDVWFRAQVLDTTGVDLANPGGGLPDRIFHWAR